METAQEEVDRWLELIEEIQRELDDELECSPPNQDRIAMLKADLKTAYFHLKAAEWHLRKMSR